MSRLIHKYDVDGYVTSLLPGGIEAVPVEDCTGGGSCGTGQGCGACGGKKRVRKYIVPVDPAQVFRTGQHIRFRYHAYHETIGALIVFGLPLLFAVMVLFTWYLVEPSSAESGPAVFSSGIALVSGFVVVRIIDRLFNRAYPPVLLPTGSPENPGNPSIEPGNDG